jgi:hypothetical protein
MMVVVLVQVNKLTGCFWDLDEMVMVMILVILAKLLSKG